MRRFFISKQNFLLGKQRVDDLPVRNIDYPHYYVPEKEFAPSHVGITWPLLLWCDWSSWSWWKKFMNSVKVKCLKFRKNHLISTVQIILTFFVFIFLHFMTFFIHKSEFCDSGIFGLSTYCCHCFENYSMTSTNAF